MLIALSQIRIYRHTSGDKKNEYWFRENLGNGSFAASYQLDIAQDCDDAQGKNLSPAMGKSFR